MAVEVTDDFRKEFIADYDAKVEDLKCQISNDEAAIQKLGEKASELQFRLNGLCVKQKELQNVNYKNERNRKFAIEYKRLHQLEGVTGITIKSTGDHRGIMLDVEVRVEYQGATYDFGDYRLFLGQVATYQRGANDEYRWLHATRTRSALLDWCYDSDGDERNRYPNYYYSRRWFCFGESASIINQHLRAGRYAQAAELAVAILHHVNPQDQLDIPNCFATIDDNEPTEKKGAVSIKRGLAKYIKLCKQEKRDGSEQAELEQAMQQVELRLCVAVDEQAKIGRQLERDKNQLAATLLNRESYVERQFAKLVANFAMLKGLTKVSYARGSLIFNISASVHYDGHEYDRGDWVVHLGGEYPKDHECKYWFAECVRSGKRRLPKCLHYDSLCPDYNDSGFGKDYRVIPRLTSGRHWLELAAFVTAQLNTVSEHQACIPLMFRRLD
ncbi:MAG: hypothetical protein LBK50_01940 [Candidatus Nomurabacteria bacterium]|jgi:hypothetical protein|nr:hypothetical protein [Candidatus Nomurabacteria bacterium]